MQRTLLLYVVVVTIMAARNASSSCPNGFYNASSGCTMECEKEFLVIGGSVVQVWCPNGACHPDLGCMCTTQPGYRGSNCLEPCSAIGCQDPDGVCGQFSETCFCSFDTWGRFCEYRCPVDEDGTICSGHGTCTGKETNSLPGCACDGGFAGELCNETTTPTWTATRTLSRTPSSTPVDLRGSERVNISVVSTAACFVVADIVVWTPDASSALFAPVFRFLTVTLGGSPDGVAILGEARSGGTVSAALEAALERDRRIGLIRRVLLQSEGRLHAAYAGGSGSANQTVVLPDCSGPMPPAEGPSSPTPPPGGGGGANGSTRGLLNVSPALPWGRSQAARQALGQLSPLQIEGASIVPWRAVSAIATGCVLAAALLLL